MLSHSIVSGALGAALKRLPTMAAARKAFAEDLRRLRRVNPELARQLMARSRAEQEVFRRVA